MSADTPTDDLEESYSDEPRYTVDLNGKRYALNETARESIQGRARHEYAGNEMFSCWWKVASPEQYTDEGWENNIHESGDPILVIETKGFMTPWEKLDKLNVEMQEADPFGGMDSGSSPDKNDAGNGMQTIDPNDAKDDDPEKVIGRTHFEQEPQDFEGVESPDGEEEDKIPAAPMEMPDHPILVKWVPDRPEVEHTWSAGEAIAPTFSWVEWNVQQYANQPRVSRDKDDGHDHWESLLSSHDCEVIAEIQPTQGTPSDSSSDNSKNEVEDIGPKYQGNNWQV